MKTSYSALDTFKTCPRKYKYQEIDKIRTPKGIEAVFGTLVHGALKYMFEKNPLYPTLDEVLDFYRTKFEEKAEHAEMRRQEKKDAELKMYRETGEDMLRRFYMKNQPWNFNVIELEGRFSFELPDEKSGETHTLTGIIDRIDKNPDTGEYEIIDYKTGAKMPPQDKVNDHAQLGAYRLALALRWPHLDEGKIKTSLYFLRHGEKLTAKPRTDALAFTKSEFLKTIRDIEKRRENGDFPATPGPLCNWCGFRNICPMWSHEYKKAEEQSPDEETVAAAVRDFFEAGEKIKELEAQENNAKKIINAYMDKNEIARVFGSYGYITRSMQERVSYDLPALKDVLLEAGVWNDILEPDSKKFAKIFPKLPPDIQSATEEKRVVKKWSMLKKTPKSQK
ncbi:PD-(D/E)XK nuclease family protein [bacterium]|nr:PD-(D/E)XK nuclease family protein [bacterium]